MTPRMFALPAAVALTVLVSPNAMADNATPQPGVYSFGPDQTVADISKLAWAPLQLDGLPPGAEVATLRGQLAAGGGEICCAFRRITRCRTIATRATSSMSGCRVGLSISRPTVINRS